MEDKQNLANGVHFLLGYAILFTACVFGHLIAIAIASVILAPAVLIKEFWYDLRYETGETKKTSIEDALGYAAGMVLAWAAFFLTILR